ncbi:uncharacterized protein M421DRAFT_384138 [Didymella exigua CBS 183.55]|uniref:Uncharacterized protein n=1 Tax=Didymella exigua CBS 183.55 TaxID=1150837 RepID=A0A6A5RR19_9PLEO|nr:uncharacterized protein M421DRAFT_384138 [Didymella exigua CBS 183.55]KAF1930079.1 hypothetical protein M421DRAFT_384138 [Didymella exigua CBS 183.55]
MVASTNGGLEKAVSTLDLLLKYNTALISRIYFLFSCFACMSVIRDTNMILTVWPFCEYQIWSASDSVFFQVLTELLMVGLKGMHAVWTNIC